MAVYTKEHMKVKSKKKTQKTTTFFDSQFGRDAAIDIDDFFFYYTFYIFPAHSHNLCELGYLPSGVTQFFILKGSEYSKILSFYWLL